MHLKLQVTAGKRNCPIYETGTFYFPQKYYIGRENSARNLGNFAYRRHVTSNFMRNPVKIAIFLTLIISSLSQAQSIDTSNVYFKALKYHIKYLKNFEDENPKIYKSPDVYFIEKDIYTTVDLGNFIEGKAIKVLSQKDIYDMTKKGKVLSLISIRPAMWKDGKLQIHIIDFGVTRKRKHFNYSNGGGSSFEIIGNNKSKISINILHQGGI